MKKIKLVFLLVIVNCTIKGQVYTCGNAITTSTVTNNSSCNTCSKIYDYIPDEILDSIVYVKLNFYYSNPTNTSAPNPYSLVTSSDADNTVWGLNQVFDSLYSANLPVNPTPNYIKRSKIRFIVNSFNSLVDDNLFYGPDVSNYTPVAPPNTQLSNQALNVVFNVDTNTWSGQAIGGGWGVSAGIPATYVTMRLNENDTYIWYNNVSLLSHELAHALGLRHSNEVQNCINDIMIEPGGIWNEAGGPCFGDPTKSNNIAGYNYSCRRYLSPQQLGVMHYNIKNVLNDRIVITTNNPYLGVNTALNWVINNNTIISENKYVKGNIIIKSGKSLTVNCELSLPENGYIIVEKGAKLIVDGGTITNTFEKLWDGIYIEGSGNGTPQNLTYQGQVEVKNGGAITNANVAVNTFIKDAYGNVNWATTGGMIFCDNANFINNVKDVQFMFYHGLAINNNVCIFKNTNFKITGPLKSNALPDSRVSLYEVNGVKFLGCNFENTTGSTIASPNYGINSIDAIYTVDKLNTTNTTIKGFAQGLRVDNSNPLKLVTIKNTDFLNNYDYGVYFNNTNNLIVENNNFTMPSLISTNGVGFSSGVYLNSSKYFNVRNNNFNKDLSNPSGYANVGVTVYNSQNGAHNIYRNNFGNLNVGILPIGNNSGASNNVDGLKMNCNDFTIAQNQYDIALVDFGTTAPTVHQIQGLTTNATSVVRNRYAAPNVSSTGENQFYIDNVSVKNYFHASNVNTNTKPLPQPNLSDPTVIVLSTAFNFNPIDCPSGIVPPNPCTSCNKLVNINSSINIANTVLQSAKTNYINRIDGGNTSTLVATVNSNMSNGNLKNLLESKSPYLSDAVLNAYFAKTSTPNGHIKDIHELNSPVSASVWQTIVSHNLPNGIMNQIIARQNEKKFSSRDVLFANVANAQTNYQAMYAEKINYFATDSLTESIDSLISILAINRSEMTNAKEQLFFAYLTKNDRVNAEKITIDIATTNSELAIYFNKLLSFQKAEQKAYAIDKNPAEKEFLITFAKSNNMASAGANSLLKFIKGINYAEPKVLPQSNNGGLRIMNAIPSETAENITIVDLYPNPTSNELNLVLSKQEVETEISVVISDALGRKMFEGTLKNNNTNTVSIKNFKAGIYILNAYNKNSLVQSSKIVKID